MTKLCKDNRVKFMNPNDGNIPHGAIGIVESVFKMDIEVDFYGKVWLCQRSELRKMIPRKKKLDKPRKT